MVGVVNLNFPPPVCELNAISPIKVSKVKQKHKKKQRAPLFIKFDRIKKDLEKSNILLLT